MLRDGEYETSRQHFETGFSYAYEKKFFPRRVFHDETKNLKFSLDSFSRARSTVTRMVDSMTGGKLALDDDGT